MLSGLTEAQSGHMDNLMEDLLVRSEAEAVFLCDRGGYILAQAVVEDYRQNDNIVALAAGSFYATREIARLVGEPEFRSVFHQGERKGIFMQNTRMDLLVVVVFGDKSSPGLVKLCADEACAALEVGLDESGHETAVRSALHATGVEIDESATLFGKR